MSEFGQFLRELRGNRSLREMERLTGVSHVQLSNLEKGVDPRTGKRSEPSFETLTKISTAFNVPFNELVSKAFMVPVKAGYYEEFEDILREEQEMRKKKDILDLLKNKKDNVYYNNKRLSDEDRQKVLDMLKILLSEYN